MILTAAGISLMGLKTPLMNIRGNLTSVLIICVIWGAVVGGAEIKREAVEKQTEPKIMARARIKASVTVVPNARAMINGTIEMMTPVIAEASMSPKRIVQTATGQETSLSNVRD